MITVKGLQKSFGTMPVHVNVSFTLGQGQKAALVGLNGTGKTTLLQMLAGLERPDAGTLEMTPGTCVGYLPQDTSLVSDETIVAYLSRISGIAELEAQLGELVTQMEDSEKAEEYGEVYQQFEHLGGYEFESRVEVMLAGFGLDHLGLGHSLADLSSGQKSKVMLMGILLKGVDLLLLDEPTNNLDLPALIWLESYLKNSSATCLIVSHDRRFLDRVVSKVFELDWHTHELNISSGTYSEYLARRAKQAERQLEQFEAQQEEIKRLQGLARSKRAASSQGSRWEGSDNDKYIRGKNRDGAGKAAHGAAVLERRIEQMELVEKPFERDPLYIEFEAQKTPGPKEIRLKDVVVGYADGFQTAPISLAVSFGERVAIMGLNGSGKSTLLNAISGQMKPMGGVVEIGSGLRMGNMMQEHETLPRESTVLDFLVHEKKLIKQRAYNMLARFGFDERHATEQIKRLSPGGRARLLLATFMIDNVNLLVLDEPTNHLDMEALEALQEALQTYEGTVLLVSHDQYFLEHARLSAVYVLADGKLTHIPDYQSYVVEAEKRADQLIKQF